MKLLREFREKSCGLRGEVPLFRALIKAFEKLGKDVLTKEYHGNRYQVKFPQQRGAGRHTPCCELCDVVFISYPANCPQLARITFNQVKVTNKKFLSSKYDDGQRHFTFKGNLEQWDLLSNRPDITPRGKAIQLPHDILSKAILPSVGSFGILYPTCAGYNFAYFVANLLRPLKNLKNAHGTLQWIGQLERCRCIHAYSEIEGTGGLCTFWHTLRLNLVGTPIWQLLYGANASLSNIDAWLSALLLELQREYPKSPFPEELLKGLNLKEIVIDGNIPNRKMHAVAKAVIIVRGKPVGKRDKSNEE